MTLREQILKDLTLSDRKYKHTLSVEKCALVLRERHFPHISEEKTSIAALLHDFTKELERSEQLEICGKYNIHLTEEEVLINSILHSKTAAALAKNIYGVDKEVQDAIYWHTTGRKNMSQLEILIYFADYIEEERSSSGCVQTRNHYNTLLKKEKDSMEALYGGLLFSFDVTLKMILAKNTLIHPSTVEARNWLIERNLLNAK